MSRKKSSNIYSLINIKNVLKVLLILAVYIVLYIVVSENLLLRQYRSVLVLTMVNIMLAVSLNLITGFLGELSLGHAGFMMIGAYTGAIFSNYFAAKNPDVPAVVVVILAVVVGGLGSAIAGLITGIPVLRLSGDYLAIVTLAFGEIVRSVAENLKITHGATGLSGITPYTNYKHFTYAYVIMIITVMIIANLIKSRQGRAILSLRENHIAAESLGIYLSRFKLMAFVIGSFFAGVAGVVHAHNQGSIFPNEAGYNKSIDILVIVVLGGMGSIKGSIIAAIVLTILPEILRDAADYRQLLYAIVLIIMMLINSSGKFDTLKEKISEKLPRFRALQKRGE